MANISTKLNLLNLKAAVRFEKSASGLVECLIIPIEQNHLFKGEKGIYLDLIGFELKEKKNDSKDTHLIKQSLPKEAFDKMTEEQKRATPILGNHVVWSEGTSGEPVSNAAPLPVDSDLPF